MPEGFPQERPHFGEGPQSIKVGGVEYRYVDIPVRPPRELRGDRTDTSLTGMGLDLQQPRQGPFVSGENMDIICGFGALCPGKLLPADGGP